MNLTPCPCCHGEKFLRVYEADSDAPPVSVFCCHCSGEGEVATEDRYLTPPFLPGSPHTADIHRPTWGIMDELRYRWQRLFDGGAT